jgi:hypothetical protein
METLLDSLISFYGFKGREAAVAQKPAGDAGIEAKLLDLSAADAGTFPYLP